MQWLRHGASDEGYCDTEMRRSTMLKRKMSESRYKKDKKTDRETGQRAGRQKSGVRGFAFLLCLMLCMEEASLTVQATEPFVSADGSQNENSDSLHEDEMPEDPAGGTDTTPGEPDGNSDDEGEKTKTPGGGASEEGAESETPDGGEGQEPPGEEAGRAAIALRMGKRFRAVSRRKAQSPRHRRRKQGRRSRFLKIRWIRFPKIHWKQSPKTVWMQSGRF